MRAFSIFVSALSLLMLSACTDSSSVKFAPKAGEKRDYRTAQTVEITTDKGRDEQFSSKNYSTIEVTEIKGDTVKLHIKPGRIEASMGTYDFRSSVPDEMPQAMLDAQAAGIDMTINLETGKLLEVDASGESLKQQLKQILGEKVDNLFEQAGQPNLPIAITPEKDWQTQGTLSGVPDVSLSVTKVDDSRVWVTYQGGTEGHRLAGLAILDRKTGWLEKQVQTSELEQTVKGKTIHIRGTQVTALVSDNEENYIPDIHAKWANHWIDLEGGKSPNEIVTITDPKNIFFEPNGLLTKDDDTLSLSLNHAAAKKVRVGDIEIFAARAFDFAGNEIDTPMHTTPTYTRHLAQDNRQTTEADLQLTSSGVLIDTIEQIAKVTAKVAWYPDETFTLRLALDDKLTAHYAKNGVEIDFKPTEQDDIYEVSFNGRPRDSLVTRLGEGQPYQVQFRANPAAPKWLDAQESNLRYIASPDPEAHRVLIKTDTPPSHVDVVVLRSASEAEVVREVTFLSERAQRFDPNVQPQTRYLFDSDQPANPIPAVKPQGVEQGQVIFPLGAEQAKTCQASLSPEAQEAGRSLVFARSQTPENFTHPVALKLQTEDGVREYFYQLGERDIRLHCDTTRTWQPANIALNEKTPWVIPLASLNKDKRLSTVGDVLSQYRFLDEKKRILSLTTLKENAELAPQTPLDDVTFPDGSLRIAGAPASVQVISVTPTPIDQSFSVTFPELPTESAE
ncbi:MAG: hypothetical protein CL578_21130 [Alteromonadaceae bacterium]|uniref:hypothetical protein n=1 Tax=Paraglaciecola chathamensis TaxID=368405 RepID=UPI000C6378E5|nr:hypothetical protein [Paraglaciecola agarilytica]MBN27528.1 hypothetical protein [Alteromonadaceae bacterium]